MVAPPRAGEPAMGCFPCFGSARDEELKYYGAKGPGGGNGGGGRAAAAASSSAAAAAGGGSGRGRAEAAVVVPPPRGERDHAGACCLRATPSTPWSWDGIVRLVCCCCCWDRNRIRGALMLGVSRFAVVGWVRMEPRLILVAC